MQLFTPARESAPGADQAPGPHSHSSASACLNDRVREAAKWLQAAFDGGRPFANLAHLNSMRAKSIELRCAKRTRRRHVSKSTSHGVRNRDVTLAPEWANAGRGHSHAHVHRLPCREVLQRRSPKDGFEKCRIGRESDDRPTKGYLRSAEQVARGCQRRCGA
jgi:hypothetical protein